MFWAIVKRPGNEGALLTSTHFLADDVNLNAAIFGRADFSCLDQVIVLRIEDEYFGARDTVFHEFEFYSNAAPDRKFAVIFRQNLGRRMTAQAH